MELSSIPRLAPGCRLHPTEDVLLIPEGTLNLTGPTREILALLDGQKTVEQVVADLLQQYPDAPADVIQKDILDLLSRLQQRGVVRA
ncbi:MAG TPA: pyrroloquinoline quinone biosynthesis peptide chaperone PqqD [Edaphobacter sp.]